VDASALKLDEEEHLVTAQEGGLDGEEVAGDDARRLRTEELAPGGCRAPRRGSEARTDDRCDRGNAAWKRCLDSRYGEYEGRPTHRKDTCIVGIAVLMANALDALGFVPIHKSRSVL